MKELTDEDKRSEIIEKLDVDVDEEKLKHSQITVRECTTCEEKMYRFTDIESVSCPICSWDQLIVDRWGDQVHMEHMSPDTYIDLTRDDAGEGQVLCHGCRENFFEHPDGTIVIHRPNHEDYKTRYIGTVITGYAHTDYKNSYDDLPKELQAVVEAIVTESEYKKVDAWRGQSIPPKKPDGFTEVMGGWHSTMTKTDASETINALDQLSKDLNIPIIKVFNQGSNVCSIGISVFVFDENKEEVKQHIEEAGTTTGYDGFITT